MVQRKFLTVLGLALSQVASPSVHGKADTPGKRPNVLFIIVDDLGTWLGAYGKPYVHSPHIDQLARSGMQFNRAYAQVPVCGASRSSMLTGMAPTRTRFTGARSSVDGDAKGAVTLPQFLRNSGYHTISYGKVFDASSDTKERSWSEPPVVPGSDMKGKR
jgi:iduronate 2-sulfatase